MAEDPDQEQSTGSEQSSSVASRRSRSDRRLAQAKKFVKDGVFYAELNDFLARELAEDGYAGCEVRVTPVRTEVIIRATRPRQVVGDQGRRVREITALVQQRFRYKQGQIILFAEKIRNKGLSALAQAQAVKFRLLQGLSVRRAAYSVVKFIMDKGAKGCEVTVSGKLRGQRAKAMKFKDGYMIHAGAAVNDYVDRAVKHVHLRQGVIGIKVKIMLPHDPTGENGVRKDLPDHVKVHDPDKLNASLFGDDFGGGAGGGGVGGGLGGIGGGGGQYGVSNYPMDSDPMQRIHEDLGYQPAQAVQPSYMQGGFGGGGGISNIPQNDVVNIDDELLDPSSGIANPIPHVQEPIDNEMINQPIQQQPPQQQRDVQYGHPQDYQSGNYRFNEQYQ